VEVELMSTTTPPITNSNAVIRSVVYEETEDGEQRFRIEGYDEPAIIIRAILNALAAPPPEEPSE
jgi:hypothetical protein